MEHESQTTDTQTSDSTWNIDECQTITDIETDVELEQCEPAETHEKWAVLLPYSDYLISDMGNIKHRWMQNDIKQKTNKDGYTYVNLIDDYGKYESFLYVHRLVAKLFLPKPHWSKYQVNHKSKCRHDNSVPNLEWVTPKENAFHRDHFDQVYK